MVSEEEFLYSPPGNIFQRFLKQFWCFVMLWVNIILKDSFKDIFTKTPRIEIEKLEKRSQQVVVMTGGTRGIGLSILKKLLLLDYTVLLGVRDISASEKSVDEIRNLGIDSGLVKLFKLDLKSLRSVRQFAKEVLASEEGTRIDLLLNNAGIFIASYSKTQDNYESVFQVNYLSHFLLTNLLLHRIKETSQTRKKTCHIVNTSSDGHHGGRIDFDELETPKVYSSMKCYFDSKLCQVMHVKTLERMFQEEKLNIHAYAVHPGQIATDMWNVYGVTQLFYPILKYIGRTTDGAANTVLYPVLKPEKCEKWGGEYFESGTVKPSHNQANRQEVQKRLWERSMELIVQSDSVTNGVKNKLELITIEV